MTTKVPNGDLPIHQIADAIAPTIKGAFLANVRRLRQSVPSGLGVQDALARGNTLSITAAINWREFEDKFVFAITPVLLRTAQTAGEAIAAKDFPIRKAEESEDLVQRVLNFIKDHPFLTAWALTAGALFVRRISIMSQGAIFGIAPKLIAAGVPPAQAEAIVRQMVGLNTRDANAVWNYRQALVARGDFSEAQIAEAVETYSDRQLRRQADTHARTMAMDASNAGLLATWRMAREQGLLGGPNDVRKAWVITPDERLCLICAPVPARGPVPLEQKFILGNGDTIIAPTAHPHCRCTMKLVFAKKDGTFPIPQATLPHTGKRPPKPRVLKPL